jgi:hypothetical protein
MEVMSYSRAHGEGPLLDEALPARLVSSGTLVASCLKADVIFHRAFQQSYDGRPQ